MPPSPIDARTRHDGDWLQEKPDDSRLQRAPRYVDISEAVARAGPRRLLDVGCGSGFLARQLKDRIPGIAVHGIDISPVALRRAAVHLEAFWEVDLDATDLPMEDEAYDTVVCVEVLEHLYDPEHALREMARVLIPGGRLVLTTPNLAYWRYRLQLLRGRVPPPAADPRHLRCFDAGLLRELLVGAGFQAPEVSGHGVRCRWLASRFPGLFSDMLIATTTKPEHA